MALHHKFDHRPEWYVDIDDFNLIIMVVLSSNKLHMFTWVDIPFTHHETI